MKFKGVYFFSSPVARTELLVLSAAPLALPSYVRALLIGVFFSQDAYNGVLVGRVIEAS